MTDARVVLTTAGSHEEAHKIARALVEHRLAACVNIVSRIESVYRWQDRVESAEEWMLVIKTTERRFPAVREAIGQLHSYELPECVCLRIDDGSGPYLTWIADSVD